MITVMRRSPMTGLNNTIQLPITEKQIAAWRSGTLIQVAMPELTPDEREFLMTGFTPDDWKKMFGKDVE